MLPAAGRPAGRTRGSAPRRRSAQPHQRLADPLVEHVALEVDREAVRAHRLLGRARLEPGHVDAAGGELLEQREQAAGVVVALEQHHRRLVGAGRLRQRTGAGDEHEAGHGRLHVADAVGEHLEPVQSRRGGGAHRGLVGLRALLEALGGGRGRQRGHVHGIRQVLAHPAAHLGPRVRVGADGAHGTEGGAGAGREHEGHRHEHLAGDDERVAAGEGVERRGDPALDGVLDRHHRAVDVAGTQGGQRRVDRAVGRALAAAAGPQASSAIEVKVPSGPR